MSSRLSASSDSSDEGEIMNNFRKLKRKIKCSSDNCLEEKPSKSARHDSSYDDKYYNNEFDERKEEDASNFETTSIKNFYDRSYTNDDKLDNASEEKSQSSYYYESNVSGYQDNNSKLQNHSSKVNTITERNHEATKEKSKISKAERMMKNWGFESGKGLGRKLQGISEPVAASTQKGRRGLGLELKELEKAHIEFDANEEIIKVEEDISWLKNNFENLPHLKEINGWQNNRKLGERKETIDGETIFCDEIIVKSVINSKSVFEKLDKNEMREARTRSNPFETIRGSIFLNRAAVKMANMDKACDFMFTQPINLQANELLYFADVCAGPGGFSEYVLWKKKWRAKGFGFTLKNENDFKLHDFYAGPCETFHPCYGPKNDGNIYDPDNQKDFKNLIMRQTENQGVHFMMADGGFSVEGQENIQEILSKQLYLCQCLVALMIVRVGGHFVTKVFDLFTPFSAGLVYIMYRCFNRISIFKPNSSRPANSERYLICEAKRADTDHLCDYLFNTNLKLLKNSKTHDVLELIPVETLIAEKEFFNFLKESNEALGQQQIVGLKKIAAYAENKNLCETRQKVMREQCLKHWGLPNQARILPRRVDPTTKVQTLLQNSLNILNKCSYKDSIKLSNENVCSTVLLNKYDWYCMPSSCGQNSLGVEDKTTFYLGMGRSQIYKYTDKGHWEQVNDLLIELPCDTLIYAETVAEMRKEERSQSKTYGLHILDAFVLGGENISQQYLSDRITLIQLFCKALWKPTNRFGAVRVKELVPVDSNLAEKLTVELKIMKNGTKAYTYSPQKHFYENDDDEPYYYILRSIVFLKGTERPWARHYSFSKQQIYFYNTQDSQSLWEIPNSAKANFAKTIQTRIIWNWPSMNTSLNMIEFMNFLKQNNTHQKKT